MAALEKQKTASSSGILSGDGGGSIDLSDKDKQKIYILQKMIEAFTGKKFKFHIMDSSKLTANP
jgi:hypothetical protein